MPTTVPAVKTLESLLAERPDLVVTPFQRRVYNALLQIPAGSVTTYAALAASIGCRSPRAVGQALRCNPLAPAVPCHRVVRSDLTLGGYMGCTDGEALAKKVRLLEVEGVAVRDGKISEPRRVVVTPASFI